MNIWVIIANSDVLSLIFDEHDVMPKVEELFLYDQTLNFIKVETWFREEGTDDASFYDWEMFSREEVVG